MNKQQIAAKEKYETPEVLKSLVTFGVSFTEQKFGFRVGALYQYVKRNNIPYFIPPVGFYFNDNEILVPNRGTRRSLTNFNGERWSHGEQDPQDGYYFHRYQFVKGIEYACFNKIKGVDKQKNYRKRNPVRSTIAYMVSGAKIRARNKSLNFNITPDYLLPFIPKDDKGNFLPIHCPVYGMELNFNPSGITGPQDNSPSLDRKNPALGYVKGNVHIISQKANVEKKDLTWEEYLVVLAMRGIYVKESTPVLKQTIERLEQHILVIQPQEKENFLEIATNELEKLNVKFKSEYKLADLINVE